MIYNSALLRIQLLRGESLEPWQIYKAIRSSFTRRGYDRHIPWKTQTDAPSPKDKEKESLQYYEEKLSEFEEKLRKMSSNSDHHFPCYYDAYIMGLWEPPDKIKNHHTHDTKRVRGEYIPSREIVESEIYYLLLKAGEQIPELKEKADYIMYGEAGEGLTEIYSKEQDIRNPSKKLRNVRYAHEKKHEGILAQKKPRFDNRILSKCCLIPRFNVCRADEPLVIQVNYLMRLRNLTYYIQDKQEKLDVEGIQKLFQKAKDKLNAAIIKKKQNSSAPKVKLSDEEKSKCFALTQAEWKKWLKKNHPEAEVDPTNNKVTESDIRGRSRFSRPALVLMKDLILSGSNPLNFYRENSQSSEAYKKFKLKVSDFEFLNRMENDWYKIHIPSIPLKEKYRKDNSNKEKAALSVLSSCRNPLVRHRAMIFADKLKFLIQKYGEPDKIVMEFVREDFMSVEKKEKLMKFQNAQKKIHEEAMKDLKDSRLSETGKNKLKMQLLKKQSCRCPYTDDALSLSPKDFDEYEIDHIIPQEGGYRGPDAVWNKVLTKRETNGKKSGKAPFEFISTAEWLSYEERIKGLQLASRTKKLLLARSRDEIEGYLERWYGLAITSWVARLAREISCLMLDWQPGEKGQIKQFHVISGGLTARIRRRNKLNDILGDTNQSEKNQKDRSDKRHHALDAMVVAYLSEWYRGADTNQFFKFPKSIGNPKDYFAEKLNEVYPRKIAKSKHALGETIYGGIKHPETKEEIAVLRKELNEYFFHSFKTDKEGRYLIENEKLKEQIKKKAKNIIDPSIRKQIEFFAKETNISADQFKDFLGDLRQARKGGSRVKKIRAKRGTLQPMKNLSKEKLPGIHGQYFESKSVMGEGTKQHGYYFYRDKTNKIKIEAVYAFDSPHIKRKNLEEKGYSVLYNQLFYSGMQVQFEEDAMVAEKKVPKEIYIIQGFQSMGERLKIKSKEGNVFLLSTKPALEAGMKPL